MFREDEITDFILDIPNKERPNNLVTKAEAVREMNQMKERVDTTQMLQFSQYCCIATDSRNPTTFFSLSH